MNYMKIVKEDIANGVGVRCVLWVSGCNMHCRGCHNPESWDYSAGQEFTEDSMQELLTALAPAHIRGLTLTGGHPLDPLNSDCVYNIIKTVREKLPEKDIWLYTGYQLSDCDFEAGTYDHETQYPINAAIKLCSVVVDGRFMEDKRDTTLRFRGSSNQRLIDVPKSVLSGKITLWRD